MSKLPKTLFHLVQAKAILEKLLIKEDETLESEGKFGNICCFDKVIVQP